MDDYFDAADPVFETHSVFMADAESTMFEISKANAGSGLSFGSDAVTAARLLPVFRDTGDAVQEHIVRWDGIERPEAAAEYHSLIRLVMSLRLEAMREGADALAEISAGTRTDDPFVGPEAAMADANAVLRRALDEAGLIRN